MASQTDYDPEQRSDQVLRARAQRRLEELQRAWNLRGGPVRTKMKPSVEGVDKDAFEFWDKFESKLCKPKCLRWAAEYIGDALNELSKKRKFLDRFVPRNKIDILEKRFDIWFSACLRNKLIDLIRSELVRKCDELREEAEQGGQPSEAEAAACRREREEILQRSLQALKEKDRDIVHAYFWNGESTREIADSMGMKTSAVKARLFRALLRLRQWLETRGYTPASLSPPAGKKSAPDTISEVWSMDQSLSAAEWLNCEDPGEAALAQQKIVTLHFIWRHEETTRELVVRFRRGPLVLYAGVCIAKLVSSDGTVQAEATARDGKLLFTLPGVVNVDGLRGLTLVCDYQRAGAYHVILRGPVRLSDGSESSAN